MSNLNFWGKLDRLREEIQLEEERKIKMREFLMREMRLERGVRAEDPPRHIRQGSIWNGLITSNFITKNPMSVLASFIIAVVASGGISLAAENSLPGDALYSVKIDVNEKMRGALVFSAKSKAELETRLAERRLEEAAELTARGNLSAETRERIEKNFEAHVEKVATRIAEFESESNVTDAADVASKFETSLTAYEQILSRLESRAEGEVKTQIRPLRRRVRNRLQSVTSKRVSIDVEVVNKNGNPEAKAAMKLAAEGKIGAATNVINSVKTFTENQKTKLGTEATANAEARLKVAEDLVVEARAKVTSSANGQAFNLAQQAIRVAQEARLLIRSAANLNISGGANFFLENETGSFEAENVAKDDDNSNEGQSSVEVEVETETETSGNGAKIEGNGRIKIDL